MWIPDIIKKQLEFQREVIKSDSGISSKSYVMVEGMKVAKLIIYWYLSVLTIEIFTKYELRTNWLEFVSVLGALSVFILASAWGKVKGEQSYWSNYGTNVNNEDNGGAVG